MNFVVDAQLPRRMALWLREQGHDALHTLDLPDGNRTTDDEVVALAMREGRVVVTKGCRLRRIVHPASSAGEAVVDLDG